MALLNESVNFKKFDTRMVDRNIARGVLSQQDLSDVLKTLPDDAENAEWISIETLAEDILGDSSSSGTQAAPLLNGKASY